CGNGQLHSPQLDHPFRMKILYFWAIVTICLMKTVRERICCMRAPTQRCTVSNAVTTRSSNSFGKKQSDCAPVAQGSRSYAIARCSMHSVDESGSCARNWIY